MAFTSLNPIRGKGIKEILVVDDDNAVATFIADVLNQSGANVTTAADGEAAIQRLAEGNFDLVLLEMVLPGIDGSGIVEYIKTRQPELLNRTILMTGDRYHLATIRAISECNLPSIFKPFDINEFRSLITITLTSSQQTIREAA
ncbi:MAG: response regulator [Phycisphaerae bacterium]|nr:response regulator [Phycisphaerae bacterium]